MKNDIIDSMSEDLELIKTIATITDLDELIGLQVRMLDYVETLDDLVSEHEGKARRFKEKVRTLREYSKIVGTRRTELSISDNIKRKELTR